MATIQDIPLTSGEMEKFNAILAIIAELDARVVVLEEASPLE